MIFYWVDAYFPWGKGGPGKFCSPNGGGVLKIFRAEFFASAPPLQVFVNGPYGAFLK